MSLSDVYHGITRVNVGDDTSALIWKDFWLDHTLEASHPRAFSFTRIEDVSIAQFLSIQTVSDGFYTPLSAQARLEIQEMQAAAAPVEPCAQPDTWVCIWGAAYSSRKFYAHYFRDVEADDAFRWI